MTTRSLSLLAAVLLTGSAAPVLAQEHYDPGEPPPLPELSEREWDSWDADPRGPDPDQPPEWGRYDPPPPIPGEPYRTAPPAGHGHRYGYLPGYPGPVMWVKVPIERRRNCCECRQAIEERIVEHRPATTKRVKIQRIAPSK